MYSRAFGDTGDRLPPHYAGTALKREPPREEYREEPREEERRESCAPPHEEAHGPCDSCEGRADKREPPRPPFHLALPYGIRFEDLLLLGLAVLLWLDGCDDEYLPLLLLFLLVVH